MYLTHPNSMVVINNRPELSYMLVWLKSRGIKTWCRFNVEHWKDFPLAISPNDGAWTDYMDRALYYIDFTKFVKAQHNHSVNQTGSGDFTKNLSQWEYKPCP